MIIPIVIDTNTITDQFVVSKENVLNLCDNIAKGLAVAYAESLKTEAIERMGIKGIRYANIVKVIDSERLVGTVLIDYSKDPLIQKMDEGSGAFDMKPGFLASPKAKLDKNGNKMMTIPMRWGTPESTSGSSMFANKMVPEIYKIAKSKAVGQAVKISELPAQYQAVKSRAKTVNNETSTVFEEYQHKTPINAGITKFKDEVTGQNKYVSFRRVSEKSDPNSWIHPGFAAQNLTDVALSKFNVQDNMQVLLDIELTRLGLV